MHDVREQNTIKPAIEAAAARFRSNQPSTLVLGDEGVFARAITCVFRGEFMQATFLQEQPPERELFSHLNFLESVICVLFLVGDRPIAEAIYYHDRIWDWFGKHTTGADFHRAKLCFVTQHASTEFLLGLADGLGLDRIDPAQGVTCWVRSEPLTLLFERLAEANSNSKLQIQKRRGERPKDRALAELKVALRDGSEPSIFEAAKSVRRVFVPPGKDPDKHISLASSFDNYCNPPAHRNGTRWRAWLAIVAENVTPERRAEGLSLLATLK